jgi:outer membrane lipoprotein-sorting protein
MTSMLMLHRSRRHTRPATLGTTRFLAVLAAVLFAATAPTPVAAQATADDPEARGLEIAVEVDRRDDGFGDTRSTLTMTLRNAHGEESTRRMRNQTLEVADDGDKSLVIFDEPRDVNGTAFLSYTHAASPDDQWLYLPALKRVKRIASNNKSGPFMGSEFAYEDIASQEVEKYTYRFVREEPLDGQDTFVIERYPVDPKSGYTKQVVWYDKAEYRPLKIDFYDRKEELLKTLTYHDYQHYLDQYWRALDMQMVNHQTGKSTELSWDDYAFQTGLTDRDFDQNSLRLAH